jgi:hypothetical protein
MEIVGFQGVLLFVQKFIAVQEVINVITVICMAVSAVLRAEENWVFPLIVIASFFVDEGLEVRAVLLAVSAVRFTVVPVLRTDMLIKIEPV